MSTNIRLKLFLKNYVTLYVTVGSAHLGSSCSSLLRVFVCVCVCVCVCMCVRVRTGADEALLWKVRCR